MSAYSFAPPNMGVAGDKKNYVFVDEHNRHRRLKVVRACDGCRRRKIKCDSATTNQWPCAACIRLKLQCIPPAVNYERNGTSSDSRLGTQGVLDFDHSDGSGDDDYLQQPNDYLNFDLHTPPQQYSAPNPSFNMGLPSYGTPPYSTPIHQTEFNLNEFPSIPLNASDSSPGDARASLGLTPNGSMTQRSNSIWSATDHYSTSELTDFLGELKIHENGVAPYISQQKKALAEAPAFEEAEFRLPKLYPTSNQSVRIPLELMPSDEQCFHYFDIFFEHVHPYVPVISKPYFYQQFRTNRRSISPLILESIFACAGRMSEDAAQGAQWLALASSHEDCFMDVPRLSTVQAMMILIKARESAPKRGYYYRSWITIKKVITMAHDLDLHEHYGQHQAGISCNSDPTECMIKTRIWQTLFILEMMIGGPQGRTDMGIDPSSVDLNILQPMPGIDTSDYQISRQFTYLVRKISSVRQMHDLKGKVKGAPTQDWVHDPRFVRLNTTLSSWLDELPPDLRVNFPDDGSAPWLPSHFVGNMHSYYHLTNVMLHRPQLVHASSFADGSWKRHMAICYESSKEMCRLQEAILQTFGINGLLCMQRGINFVIYAVLTCTMVHLVAITSPDPEFNSDAKDYFTRHMRILEICTTAWPQQDMQKQIDALRDAFSADTSRPFELKAGFPYGSPRASGPQPSPPMDDRYRIPTVARSHSHGQLNQGIVYQPAPMTPPMTAGLEGFKEGMMGPPSMSSSSGQQSFLDESVLTNGQATWNPTPIFEGWNAAFGEHSASMADVTATLPLSPSSFQNGSGQSPLQPRLSPAMQSPFTMNHQMPNMGRSQSISHTPLQTIPEPSFVTPNMWRESVASAYDPSSLKRGWDQHSSFLVDPVQSKRTR